MKNIKEICRSLEAVGALALGRDMGDGRPPRPDFLTGLELDTFAVPGGGLERFEAWPVDRAWNADEDALFLIHESANMMRDHGPVPPAGAHPEVLAWYRPITYYGLRWGIVFDTDALLAEAAKVMARVPLPDVGEPLSAARECLVAVTEVIAAHEALHHLVESAAIDMTSISGVSVYRRYDALVYAPSPDPLEEGLANAYMHRRSRSILRRLPVRQAVRDAAAAYVADAVQTDTPGYRLGRRLLGDARFNRGLCELLGEVHGSAYSHYAAEWQLHRLRSATKPLFTIDEIPRMGWSRNGVAPLQLPSLD